MQTTEIPKSLIAGVEYLDWQYELHTLSGRNVVEGREL